MSQVLKFKNYHLEAIEKALNYPNQNFQIGRAKMRILKIIDEKKKMVEASRMEMLNSFTTKGEDGKPLMKKVMVQRNPQLPPKLETQFDLTEENMAKFNKEFVEMMGEDCLIDIPGSLKNDFSIFKGLVANSQAKDLSDADIAAIEEALEVMHADDPKEPAASDSESGGIPSPLSPKPPKK